MVRRRSPLAVRATLLHVGLVVGLLSGCSGDPAATPTPTPTPPASTTPTAPTSDPSEDPTIAPGSAARPPITEPTPATAWTGDDAAYLAALATNIEASGVEPLGSEAESIGLGRDFCTVLSGGGLVGDKISYWATQYTVEDAVADLGNAAGPIYCPAAYAAYVPITQDPKPAKATPPERADLFRFIVGRTADNPEAASEISDERIRKRATDFCARLREPGASISEITNLDPQNEAERLQASYALGLGFSYCPGAMTEIMQHP